MCRGISTSWSKLQTHPRNTTRDSRHLRAWAHGAGGDSGQACLPVHTLTRSENATLHALPEQQQQQADGHPNPQQRCSRAHTQPAPGGHSQSRGPQPCSHAQETSVALCWGAVLKATSADS